MLLLFFPVLLQSMLLQHWSKIRAIALCTLSVFVWRDVQVNNKPAWGHKARQGQTLEKKKTVFFHFSIPTIHTEHFITSPSFPHHLESPLPYTSCQHRALPKGKAWLGLWSPVIYFLFSAGNRCFKLQLEPCLGTHALSHLQQQMIYRQPFKAVPAHCNYLDLTGTLV